MGHPLIIIAASSALCWGAVCFYLGHTNCSWVGVFAAGFIITLNAVWWGRYFPRLALALALVVNSFLVLILIFALAIDGWSPQHPKRKK